MLSSSNDPCYCSDAVHSVRYRTDFRFYSTMQSIYPSGHRCQNKLGMLSLLSRYENQEFSENQIYNLSHKPSKAPRKPALIAQSLFFSFMTTPNLPAIPATARQIPVLPDIQTAPDRKEGTRRSLLPDTATLLSWFVSDLFPRKNADNFPALKSVSYCTQNTDR